MPRDLPPFLLSGSPQLPRTTRRRTGHAGPVRSSRARLVGVAIGVVTTTLGLDSVILPTSAEATRGAFVRPLSALSSGGRTGNHSPRLLPLPTAVQPFAGFPMAREGQWRPAGRPVHGVPAVYTTTIRLPGGVPAQAGIAWMDTPLLRARLYSGSLSPGGLFWKYTAPISRGASKNLVAAFNGGFLLKASNGGYLSEDHLVAPLRVGAASLVIFRNGSMTVGQWGRDVKKGPTVVAIRQNLTLLVDRGRPVPGLNPNDTATWGASLNGVVSTWRSGIGVTANGALVYVVGPMNIVDLAQLFVRAGAVRAMVLDMNPLWPVFATYSPATPTGFAAPGNGKDLLPTMVQTPARFFQVAYARDFITMSAR